MNTLKQSASYTAMPDGSLTLLSKLLLYLVWLLTFFIMADSIIKLVDPSAAVLDIGILSMLLFGIICGVAAIFCSLWLQELLWQPFKTIRQNLSTHLNKLSSWQQCILYFSVFFLLLYAALWALAIVI